MTVKFKKIGNGYGISERTIAELSERGYEIKTNRICQVKGDVFRLMTRGRFCDWVRVLVDDNISVLMENEQGMDCIICPVFRVYEQGMDCIICPVFRV